jgi:hypothetical protein
VLQQVGKVKPAPRSSGADLVLDVGGSPRFFEIKWVGEGFPEDVERGLAAASQARDPDHLLLLVARRMSVGARRDLKARGISWVDETGAARVGGPGLLVDRQSDEKKTGEKAAPWTWSPAAAAVGEVVLTQSYGRGRAGDEIEVWREARLAELAGVSVPSVSQTLRAWQREGWVEKRGAERGATARRVLVSPGDLLSSWAAWTDSQSPTEESLHVLFRDAVTWAQSELPALMPRNIGWCVGGLVASEQWAPFATSVPQVLCHVTEKDFEDAVARMRELAGVRPVERGARLILRSTPDVTIRMASVATAMPLAGPPRVYADLLSDGVRGPELAAHLRDVVLGF